MFFCSKQDAAYGVRMSGWGLGVGSSGRVGIRGGNRQVVSLGSDIAKELMPHFEWMVTHFTKLEATIRADAQRTMLDTKFSDVVLLAPYEEEDLDETVDGTAGPASEHGSQLRRAPGGDRGGPHV